MREKRHKSESKESQKARQSDAIKKSSVTKFKADI
jgi:hypothetical protein